MTVQPEQVLPLAPAQPPVAIPLKNFSPVVATPDWARVAALSPFAKSEAHVCAISVPSFIRTGAAVGIGKPCGVAAVDPAHQAPSEAKPASTANASVLRCNPFPSHVTPQAASTEARDINPETEVEPVSTR